MRTKLHALVNPADGGTGLNMLGDIPILRIVGEVAGEMAGYSPSRTSDKTHCLKIGVMMESIKAPPTLRASKPGNGKNAHRCGRF